MKQVMIAIMALMLITNNAQAGFFDFLFKSKSVQHEQKHLHHHHRKLSKLIKKLKKKYNNKKKCRDNDFRSWRDLERSSTASIVEDESSITVTSDCDLRFKPMFSFKTDKVLTIEAKEIQFMSHTKLEAARMILVADKLETAKHSKLCAEIVVLEAEHAKHKGKVCDSAQTLGSVLGQPSAIANLSVQVASEFAPAQVNFDWSNSFGVYTEAQLDLGNGQSVGTTEKSYSHVYEDAGEYSVQVRLQTPGGEALSALASFTLKTAQADNPIADFNLLHLIRNPGTPPEAWIYPNLYPLVDLEQHQIKEYRYTFSDGTTVTLPFTQAPDGFVIHSFPSMGEYDVTLEVVTMDGHSKTVTTTLNLNNPTNPVPKYSVSSFKGETPLTVTFTGEGQDNEDSEVIHYWVMPDTGEVFYGTEFNQIEHTFNESGIFYVRYEVRDSLRGNRITYIPIYVGVEPDSDALAPVAVIDTSARFGEGPLTVDFSGVRSFDPNNNGTPLSYYWNFADWRSGEQNEAFTANASHTFQHSGSYFVTLVVINSEGLQHSEFIFVYVDGPEVNDIDFAVTPTGNPNEFFFDASGFFYESDYSFSEPLWSFGDGAYFTNEPFATHQYQNAGTYDVELKMRRVDGDYQSYTRRLIISDDMTAPMVAIQAQNEWFNIGEATQLTANFIEGTSSERTIYRWALGDGSIIKGQGDQFKSIIHTYSMEESMQVRLMVTADNGLTSQAEFGLQPNRYAPEINGLTIYGLENAFAPARLAFAPWETTVDHDGNFSHFIYEFGDGSPIVTTTEGYLEHDYNTAGQYTVAVTAVDSNGRSTRYETVISINENLAPIIAYVPVYADLNEPAPVRVAFVPWEGSSDDQYIEHWTYNFGDGSPEVVTQDGYLEHDYLFAGNFTATITAHDPYGLTTTYSIPLEIKANQPPVLTDFDLHIPDEAAPVTVSAAPWPYASDSDGYPEIFEYNWGDGTVEQTVENFKEHIYQLGGEFQVSVRVRDNKGDWSAPVVKTASIRSNVPPTASIALLDQNVYAPTTLRFGAFESSDVDGVVENFLWALSDGRTFEGSEIEIDFPAVDEFTLNLQVVDNKGGIGTTSYALEIKPNDAPIAIINVAKTEINAFEVLEFDGSLSHDPNPGQKLNMEWHFSDGKILRGEKVYHFFENEGSAQAQLIVTDESGLVNSTTQLITVTPLQVPPPEAVIAISGAKGPNGGYRGEISFDAKGSSTNFNDEILTYEWEFDDGMYFEGAYIARGFEQVGEHSATLTVKTALGLARSVTQSFVIEQVNDPQLAYSDKLITLTSPDVLVFQPNNVRVQWTLEEGTFHSELETNIFVNDEMLDRANLQLVAPNILEADVTLQDGKNIVQIFGFDNEEYQILQEQVIYSGSRTVAVTINDHNGNPVENQAATIFMADNKEVKSQFVTDVNGVAQISNVPSVEAFIVATAPNFYATGSLQAETVSKVLTGIELNPALVSNENMDFSNGLIGWDTELPVYEITSTEEGPKLSASITDGQRMKLRRVVKLDREGFVNLPFNLTANLAMGSMTAVMTNTRTGEVANISQAIDSDNQPTISEQLFIHGELDDIVVLDLEIVMNGDGVSFVSRLLDSYANTGNMYFDTTGIKNSDYVVTPMFAERSTDKNGEEVPEKLNYLSIIDFDTLKNGTTYDVDHFAHFTFKANLSNNIESVRAISIRVSQGETIIDSKPVGADAQYVYFIDNCYSPRCIRPENPFSSPFTLDLMKGNRQLISNQSVVFNAEVEVRFKDGRIEYPTIKSQTITPANFLFAHDWTYDERHYDEGGLDHYNLDSNFAPETDKGDFWSNRDVRDAINAFILRVPSFRVGDVSNINGNSFSPHGFHVRGNEFDGQTEHFKSGNEKPFSKKSIDDLESLLTAPIIQSWFRAALAAYDKAKYGATLENRCVQGRTLNNYIVNDAGHFNHWHFSGPGSKRPNPVIPLEEERVTFALDGFVEGQEPLTPVHPLYPDYEYIRFSSNSPELLERYSFRLRDMINKVDLFESYEDDNFENDFIKIVKVSDGVVYKIKTENLANVTDPNAFPAYTLIAVAVATGGRELCDKKDIPVFNIEKDCNRDGVEGDLGYKTLLGGVIGLGIDVPEGMVVQNDARVCGENTTVIADTITVDNGALLENVQIGNTCNSILIDGGVHIHNNSKICTVQFRDQQKFGTMYISGAGVNIDNSTLYGDVNIGAEVDIIDTTIEGNSVSANRSYIYKSTVTGHAFISSDAFISDSLIAASPSEALNTNYENVTINGAGIVSNSHVSGIGIVEGYISNGRLAGAGSFLRSDGYILMHLWRSGAIFNGGRASGNGWISGNIQAGGVGNFSGSLYFHSGVQGTIGAGGNANCFFLVQAGQLNKSICNQVYNGFRNPNVMNLNDWINGKPWPDPLP